MKKILILGAGVSGLSVGITLLKKGYSVLIWAKDLPPNTTSDKAAALWYPYLCFPREKAIPWARMSFDYFEKEMVGKPETGCIKRTLTEYFDTPQPQPWWKDAISEPVTRPTAEELPDGYVDAYRFDTVVIDTSVYMPYLVNTFRALGGGIVQKNVANITEAFAESSLVVNCTGLGSRELFHDEKVYPVRGQMVKIKKGAFGEVRVDDTGHNTLALAVARAEDIMLGGTAQENNWNMTIDPEDTKDILRKVKNIAPMLEVGDVIGESVGLRPAREAIRLEVEHVGDKTIVHNYGHGGAGFTLSWGCAEEVATLIDNLPEVL